MKLKLLFTENLHIRPLITFMWEVVSSESVDPVYKTVQNSFTNQTDLVLEFKTLNDVAGMVYLLV